MSYPARAEGLVNSTFFYFLYFLHFLCLPYFLSYFSFFLIHSFCCSLLLLLLLFFFFFVFFFFFFFFFYRFVSLFNLFSSLSFFLLFLHRSVYFIFSLIWFLNKMKTTNLFSFLSSFSYFFFLFSKPFLSLPFFIILSFSHPPIPYLPELLRISCQPHHGIYLHQNCYLLILHLVLTRNLIRRPIYAIISLLRLPSYS